MELGTIIDVSPHKDAPFGGDVTREAIDRGWIREFAEGQYIYTTDWVRLVRKLQSDILDQASALGFEEWLFPRLIPRQALDTFRLSQYAPELLIPAGVDQDKILDPVQCISLYESLRGSTVDITDKPIRIVETMGGWTWRDEISRHLDGPIKAREFLRVEHVFLGTKEQVRTSRRQVREGLTSLLTKWGLSWQIVAAEGCMEIPSLVNMQETAETPDEIPVQDIEVPLSSLRPERFRPSWADGFDERFDLRELSGCSAEGSHMTESFDIKAANGEELWSGCCGIGLNRLAVGYLYQHGFDATQKMLNG